jgi:hypothetical protein
MFLFDELGPTRFFTVKAWGRKELGDKQNCLAMALSNTDNYIINNDYSLGYEIIRFQELNFPSKEVGGLIIYEIPDDYVYFNEERDCLIVKFNELKEFYKKNNKWFKSIGKKFHYYDIGEHYFFEVFQRPFRYRSYNTYDDDKAHGRRHNGDIIRLKKGDKVVFNKMNNTFFSVNNLRKWNNESLKDMVDDLKKALGNNFLEKFFTKKHIPDWVNNYKRPRKIEFPEPKPEGYMEIISPWDHYSGPVHPRTKKMNEYSYIKKNIKNYLLLKMLNSFISKELGFQV